MSRGSNPSDFDGPSKSQDSVYGVVIDRNDPKQQGRVKIRMTGIQGSEISDEQCAWYPVQSGSPQTGGTGHFPASAGYQVGGRVCLQNLGQQGYVATGNVPNSPEDGGNDKQDQNREVQDKDGPDKISVNKGTPGHRKARA